MTNTTITVQHVFQCVACTRIMIGWLPMWFSVAGATFMNEFVLYTMHAPPFMGCTRQRFTAIDFRQLKRYNLSHFFSSVWKGWGDTDRTWVCSNSAVPATAYIKVANRGRVFFLQLTHQCDNRLSLVKKTQKNRENKLLWQCICDQLPQMGISCQNRLMRYSPMMLESKRNKFSLTF